MVFEFIVKLLNQVVNTFATSNLAFLRQTVNRVKENSAHFKIMKRKFPVFSPGIFGLSHCFHYHTQQWVSLRGSLLSVSICNRHIIACCCYFCRSRPSSTPSPPFLDFLPWKTSFCLLVALCSGEKLWGVFLSLLSSLFPCPIFSCCPFS